MRTLLDGKGAISTELVDALAAMAARLSEFDAAETAMETRNWPVPVVYKEVARTSCV